MAAGSKCQTHNPKDNSLANDALEHFPKPADNMPQGPAPFIMKHIYGIYINKFNYKYNESVKVTR